ncbi:MAG: hypothetical protein M1816_001938 [Peltula sp. TS41687]|nr:MAG: hypothetical protein M1816_001938 [Peltula sp. TS41687]
MAPASGIGAIPGNLDGSDLRIAIVSARWNRAIIEQLLQGLETALGRANVPGANIYHETVPGSFELPYAVQRLARRQKFDAIIAVGVLIKGETMHFEYIADAVAHGLMRVQLDEAVPVVFGVLTVLSEEQAWARAGGSTQFPGGHNHGEDWGSTAVELGLKRKREL